MANCNRQQLNITCGTDVVLHDRLIFEGETFDPNLSVGIAANLVSSLGKRTALDVQVVDDELLISVPWVDGTLPGCYGLEVTGSCNSKKWATYADSLIKYTKATRIGVSEVTVESDSYDITMEIGYRYGEGGNVDDVKVNGVSVVSAGKANITMPTKVSQLANDSGYQNARQVAHAIEKNLVPNAVVSVDDNTGTPSATVTKSGNTLNFDFKNMKGKPFTYEDFTPQQLAGLVGPKGDQGDSAIWTGEGEPWSGMKNTTGQSTTEPMTQKAVTDKFLQDTKTLEFGLHILSKTESYSDLNLGLLPKSYYRVHVELESIATANVGFYLRESVTHGSQIYDLGRVDIGNRSADLYLQTDSANEKQYIQSWSNEDVSNNCVITLYKVDEININDIYSQVIEKYSDVVFELGSIFSGEDAVGQDLGIRTDFIPLDEDLNVKLFLDSNLPEARSQFLVFYKDGVFVRSEQIEVSADFTIQASPEFSHVRVLLYRMHRCTQENAKNSHAYITPPRKRYIISDLGNWIKDVIVNESDLTVDLSNEVLDLSDVSSTNAKFSGTNIVSDSNWRLVDDILPANAGVYYVLDNDGVRIDFQIAYVDGEGNVLKLHYADSGGGSHVHMVSNYYIDALSAQGLRIAVHKTSLNGLHLSNGRKFIIKDQIKRQAFESQCADGRINVAYIKGTDSDRITTAIKMAGDFGIVYIPSGRYDLTYPIYAGGSAGSIEMASDAMLVADDSFSGNYLMEWSYLGVDVNDPEFSNTYGESSALINAHITGGVFDAKGKCGCLRIFSFRGFHVSNCHFYNASTKAVSVEKPGFELIMSNCSARNNYKGLEDNIAFNLVCNDCHYHDLVSVNYKYGFVVKNGSFLERCHPWLGRIDWPTYYPGSIGFDISESNNTTLVQCYSDCMQTHYKTGRKTKLIGCYALSYENEYFDMHSYGNVNIVDSNYSGVSLIGCVYSMGSGVQYVKNSGNAEIEEIGCS